MFYELGLLKRAIEAWGCSVYWPKATPPYNNYAATKHKHDTHCRPGVRTGRAQQHSLSLSYLPRKRPASVLLAASIVAQLSVYDQEHHRNNTGDDASKNLTHRGFIRVNRNYVRTLRNRSRKIFELLRMLYKAWEKQLVHRGSIERAGGSGREGWSCKELHWFVPPLLHFCT